MILKDDASKYSEIFKNATHATAGIAPASGIIPVPATKEGLVVIGDAAGMCNPVTGAGIYNAVYSAYIAAEKISLSNEKNDRSILSEIKDSYNDSFSKSIGRAVKKREYMLDNWQGSSVSFDEMIRKSWIAFRDYWK
ncbi:MAG: Squalene epoxidase [Actinobacteria bacterium ADurb.Bin346]|nr:MAG: Squalene epoxidase [Actinobacteria bacterium ADurb.Bin346]